MANSANSFAVAVGSSQTALKRMEPQPHTNGLEYPMQTVTPSAVYRDGEAFARLRFNAPDGATLDKLYAAFGLTSADYAAVTISLPTNKARTVWADYNGQAVKPLEEPWQIIRYGWVEIMVRQLEAV